MRFKNFSFGSIHVGGNEYAHEIVLDRDEVRRREKKPSKKFREEFGHMPLSIEEDIPWKCSQLVIGTGVYGRLPVMQELRDMAERKKVKLLILPTVEAIEIFNRNPNDTNAILHVTCKLASVNCTPAALDLGAVRGVT